MLALVSLLAGTAMWLGRTEPQVDTQWVKPFNPINCDGAESQKPTQKAFATAEGFGRFARGGRGGRVYLVSTLEDSGPGSLRECAEAAGPRTCIFRVSGTIALTDWIRVMHPYLTIAGQTSPGGIALRVDQSLNSPLLIQAHDVIVRHIRIRPGPSTRPSDNVDTVQISGGAHDVILDHVSTSWPTDEGINIVGSGHKPFRCGETRNITIQWSILSEGLNKANRGPHSRGAYFGYGAQNVSFHHNLIAGNVRRNPLVNMRGQFDMINNVIYNSALYNAEFYTRFGALNVNLVGNVAIVGPSSDKTTRLYLADYFRDFPADFGIYLRDNIDVHRPTNIGDQRLVLEPHDWKYVQTSPLGSLSLQEGAITGPAQAYRDVLANAGSIKPQRDSVDQRVMADMQQCKGRVIDDPADVGGWPDLSGGVAPPDRDNDGMADDWERAHGLSPTDAADRNRVGPDGHTFLEVYLGELAGDIESRPNRSKSDPDPSCGFDIKQAPPSPDIRMVAQPVGANQPTRMRLVWSGDHIRHCKLEGKSVPASGSLMVEADRPTTYQIMCTGIAGGDTIDSVTLAGWRQRAPAEKSKGVEASSPR
ncbi:MAG: pectate lyase [Pseudomonadota bacterium]|jgi:pectate lyase